jgi:hypothetical protein
MTWRHLALAAWAAYNGSGEVAERYAQRLALSEEGASVSLEPVSVDPYLAFIEPPPPLLKPPGPWIGEGSLLMT